MLKVKNQTDLLLGVHRDNTSSYMEEPPQPVPSRSIYQSLRRALRPNHFLCCLSLRKSCYIYAAFHFAMYVILIVYGIISSYLAFLSRKLKHPCSSLILARYKFQPTFSMDFTTS